MKLKQAERKQLQVLAPYVSEGIRGGMGGQDAIRHAFTQLSNTCSEMAIQKTRRAKTLANMMAIQVYEKINTIGSELR